MGHESISDGRDRVRVGELRLSAEVLEPGQEVIPDDIG